jgi:hypothetical protein
MTARANTGFRTEIEFTLPKGYLDETGILHRHGTMRLATAADEILPLRDPRVQQNPAYLAIIVLARVIVKLGSLAEVDNKTNEQFNSAEEIDSRTAETRPQMAVNGRLGEHGGFGVMGEA